MADGLYRLQQLYPDLEDAVDELDETANKQKEKLDRLESHNYRLLQVLGVSDKKADFIYSVLDLEKDSRVASVNLRNLDLLTAEVGLTTSFRDIDSLRSYLEKRGVHPVGTISRKGSNYRLEQSGLGVAVYFFVKKE